MKGIKRLVCCTRVAQSSYVQPFVKVTLGKSWVEKNRPHLLVTIRKSKPWSFIVPSHGTYFPSALCHDELNRYDASAFKCRSLVDSVFFIGAKTMGYVSENFRNLRSFDFFEAS